MHYRLPNLEQLYNVPLDARTLEWRSLGAADKSQHIANLTSSVRDQITSVLEVGCGTGAVLAAVRGAGVGTRHVGVDLGDRSGQVRDTQGGALHFDEYDGDHLPYEDESFDLVYATHVLEHVRDERAFLSELRRVARRFVFVEVPCELNLRTSYERLQETLDIGHINAYTPESFILTLETSGLRVRDQQLYDHSFSIHRFRSSLVSATAKTGLRRLLLRLSPNIAAKVFTYHAAALCERASSI